jgi:hypothetical protein
MTFQLGTRPGGRALHLREGAPHWLQHTFAKAALLIGQSMRAVAGAPGRADPAFPGMTPKIIWLISVRQATDS